MPVTAIPPARVLRLQRAAGNQAVVRMVGDGAPSPAPPQRELATFPEDAATEVYDALEWFNDVPRAMRALTGHNADGRARLRASFEKDHGSLAGYLYDQLDGADLVRAFALLDSSNVHDPSTALGLALIPRGTRDEEVLRILEGSKLAGRWRIEKDYDRAFGTTALGSDGLMKGSLRADLEDDLSGWRKRKALTLLDRDLSKADHLYFVTVGINGTHDESAIAIVQEVWSFGPAAFAKLEADWAAHYGPASLRTAMSGELSLEAWLLVKAILDANDAYKRGEGAPDASKELKPADRERWREQEALLEAARRSIAAATTGESWYEGAGTNEEQLNKALETIRAVWQERIDKAVEDKRPADAKDYRKRQNDERNEHKLGEELSGTDLQKASLLTSGALTDADEIYLAAKNLDSEKVVALVTTAWAAGRIGNVLADAAKEKRGAGGVRPAFTVNMLLPIGGTPWHRVNWLSRADHDDGTRGANRLGMELDNGDDASDLANAVSLLTLAKPDLCAATTSKFSELRKLPGEGDAETRLIDYIDGRFGKVEEAVALRDLLRPAKTPQEHYERAELRMAASKTGFADELLADWIRDYDTLSGEHTQAVTAESLERLKFLAQQATPRDVSRIAAQRGIKGSGALAEVAKLEYGDFKTRLAEAEAVEGAIVEALTTTLELAIAAALTALTGGAAGGLLVASLSSAVAGMLAREALMGDKYDLQSKENAQKIAGIVAGAAFGALGSELMASAQSLEKMGRLGAFVQDAVQEAFGQVGTTTVSLAFDMQAPTAEHIAAGAINLLVGTAGAGTGGAMRFKVEDAAPFAEQLRVRFAASLTAGVMNTLSEQGGESLKQGGMGDMTGPELLGQVGRRGFEAAKGALIQSLGEIGAARKRAADEARATKAAGLDDGDLESPGGGNGGPHEPAIESSPESLVHYRLDAAGAHESYRASIDTDQSREAAIWFDPSTGQHLVVQGGAAFVSGWWLEDPEFKGRPWRIVEHYHPGEADVAKYASPADFRVMMRSQLHGVEEPVAVKSDIRYRDAQGNEHVTEFGYDPEFGYWMGFRDQQGKWDVQLYDDEPWANGSRYSEFLAGKGLVAQGAARGGRVESAGAAHSPDAVRARIADVRAQYGADYADRPAFGQYLAKIERTAGKRPEEAAAKLEDFVDKLLNHDKAMGETRFDPHEEGTPRLDERDKAGGKLATRDARPPWVQLAERMAPIYGRQPEGHAAHHIVAESDPRGELARRILLDNGIHPNDGINGAYLPRKDPTIVREADIKHANVHTNAYYEEITMRLLLSNDVEQTLREVHSELLGSKEGLGVKSREQFHEWAERNRDTLRDRFDDDEIDEFIKSTRRRAP